MPKKLSAFVITFNRMSLLETCLRAVSFADELVVIDKSSTDNSAEVAACYADRVERVPWSPTVEETRAFAVSLCRHKWILCLDDDEILSPQTGPYLQQHLADLDADIVTIPYRHYILGVHDERAYYWPEVRHCLFRKGAIEFTPTVHGGVVLQSDRIFSIPPDSGVCIHHLSYPDIAGWIDRTNRYTRRPDRIQAETSAGDLVRFAHDRIDHWMRRSDNSSGNDYPAAVALLRAIYDMVDRLKAWETERGIDGAEMFRIAQRSLVPPIEGSHRRTPMRTGDGNAPELAARQLLQSDEPGEAAGLGDPADDDQRMAMQGLRVQFQAAEAHLRERTEAARKVAASLAGTRRDLAETTDALTATRQDLDATRDTLRQTNETLDEMSAAFDHTCATLADTQARLNAIWADLINTRQEFERLGNSGRVFVRQYLPKLGQHLLRRLKRAGPAGEP